MAATSSVSLHGREVNMAPLTIMFPPMPDTHVSHDYDSINVQLDSVNPVVATTGGAVVFGLNGQSTSPSGVTFSFHYIALLIACSLLNCLSAYMTKDARIESLPV